MSLINTANITDISRVAMGKDASGEIIWGSRIHFTAPDKDGHRSVATRHTVHDLAVVLMPKRIK